MSKAAKAEGYGVCVATKLLEPEYKELRKLAYANGTTPGEIVRQAIRLFIERREAVRLTGLHRRNAASILSGHGDTGRERV